MAPIQNPVEKLRRSNHKRATGTKNRVTRRPPKAVEDDGDVLMGGYRIPTIISSKGAIQHKLDRYAPGETNRRNGHKRDGGRWDEYRQGQQNRNERSASPDEAQERFGDRNTRYNPIILNDDYSPNQSSRKDRYTREYHHVVASSRIRTEQHVHASRKQIIQHTPTRNRHTENAYESYRGSMGPPRDMGERGSRSRYPSNVASEYASSHNYAHSQSERRGGERKGPRDGHIPTGPWNPTSTGPKNRFGYSARLYDKSHTSNRYDNERSHYDRGRVRHNLRAHVYNQYQETPEPHLDGSSDLEGAMQSLASHAAKFLKHIHFRDREAIKNAVWKAYGDSIASLGNRNSKYREDRSGGEWVSTRGIPGVPDGDPLLAAMNTAKNILGSHTGFRDEKQQRIAASAALYRGVALENYQKANQDYEQTLVDLFGSGASTNGPNITPTASSRAGSSYTGSETGSHRSSSRAPSRIAIRGRSRSPSAGSTSTITGSQQQAPRSRVPRDWVAPVYKPYPNDPNRFMNVPRPRMRKQWHIPADYYNGAAWVDHHKNELESGALSSFYPDRWFNGQSFGDSGKDLIGKERAASAMSQTNREPIGRECYDLTTSPTKNNIRSQSVSSELRHNINGLRLDSAPPSIYGGSRAPSENSEDINIYDSPARMTPGQSLFNTPVQQQDDYADEPEGSKTPTQCFSPVYHPFIREGSTVSQASEQGTPRHMHFSRENTPSLCLANIIDSDATFSKNPLLRGNPEDLISLASVTSSRCTSPVHGHPPSYHPLPYSHTSNGNRNGTTTGSNKIAKTSILDDDWDASFSTVATNRRLFPTAGVNTPLGKEKATTPIAKAVALVPSSNADDDLDFLGVEWFAK